MAAEGLVKGGSASVIQNFIPFCMNLGGVDQAQRLGVRWMPHLGWKREDVRIELWNVY